MNITKALRLRAEGRLMKEILKGYAEYEGEYAAYGRK